MKLSELTIIYGFKGEAVFFDLHTFLSNNGPHSLNDFYTTALFAVNDYYNNIMNLNDSFFWLPFEEENKPFKIKGLEGEYILEFKCEGNAYYKIKEIVHKYWLDSKVVECHIKEYNKLEEETQEVVLENPFNWRPKRIEISDCRY
jgi:hypothetical protein